MRNPGTGCDETIELTSMEVAHDNDRTRAQVVLHACLAALESLGPASVGVGSAILDAENALRDALNRVSN